MYLYDVKMYGQNGFTVNTMQYNEHLVLYLWCTNQNETNRWLYGALGYKVGTPLGEQCKLKLYLQF